MRKLLWFMLPCLLIALTPIEFASAQDAASDDIESLYSQEEATETATEAPETKVEKTSDLKDLSDLVKLAPFKDVAVIQKRFLPKTQRFELFAGPSIILNDPFFLGYGVSVRAAYYFKEKYGMEFVGLLLTQSERDVIGGLRTRGVTTNTIVSPKNYVGLDFKWVPIYGKMTLRNKSITPFDMYFSFGGGMTGTNQSYSEPTIHLGSGQSFALSKSTAFRWDFSWDFFSGRSKTGVTGAATNTSIYNNLYVTLGMSFFFPEATYR